MAYKSGRITGAPSARHYTVRVPCIGKVLNLLPGKAIEFPELPRLNLRKSTTVGSHASVFLLYAESTPVALAGQPPFLSDLKGEVSRRILDE